MTIAIDMMGGDFAPLEALKGIQYYFSEHAQPAHLFLVGDETKLLPLLAEYAFAPNTYTVVHAPQVIDMHEHPTRALKEKQQSSIAVGFGLLAASKADAFISAGNTG